MNEKFAFIDAKVEKNFWGKAQAPP